MQVVVTLSGTDRHRFPPCKEVTRQCGRVGNIRPEEGKVAGLMQQSVSGRFSTLVDGGCRRAGRSRRDDNSEAFMQAPIIHHGTTTGRLREEDRV